MVANTCSQDASRTADLLIGFRSVILSPYRPERCFFEDYYLVRTWGLRRAVQSSRLVCCADIVRGVLVAAEALPGNAYEVYDMELGFYFCFCKNK